MKDPLRARVRGPLEQYAGGFCAELTRLGYATGSACVLMGLMAHLSRWMSGEGLDPGGLTPSAVERFLAARRAAGYAGHLSGHGLEPLLGYLRRLGEVPGPVAVLAVTPEEVLLERYRGYLAGERGVTAPVARSYARLVRPFLAGRVTAGAGGLVVEQLTAGDVAAFVLAECGRRSSASAKMTLTALRSLLRYLQAEGALADSLAGAVPQAAGWALAGLPRALEPGQVRLLLASCDRSVVTGRRDFAVLMLLARLGLRAGEVAGLMLDDIDWRAGVITVRGKGHAGEQLPLPADVGQAVAVYLECGRPATTRERVVFATIRAPHRRMSPSAVGSVVAAAGKRAGLGPVAAHRLRHSAATALLRAGAPLPEVGQVLRHRRLLSTAIYAKVDHLALRELARPWPGGTP